MVYETIFTDDNGEKYYLCPVLEDEIDKAVAICDEFVGANMYTKQELTRAQADDDKFFYFLVDEKGETVGYFYFYITQLEDIVSSARLDKNKLSEEGISEKKTCVGKLQSIGVSEKHRRKGLSVKMMSFAEKKLYGLGIDTLFGMCWKIENSIPMKRTMDELGFVHLCDAERFWYDISDLVCPHCGGRCKCDAAIYYKQLN